jgi:hypothetical protein
MKTNGFADRCSPCLTALLLGLILAACVAESHGAKAYQVGDIVQDFTLITRRPWTNQAGRVFTQGSPLRLSDFAGSVLFVKFFDAT